MRLSFPKSEKLRHKTLVDGLFAKGKSIYEYPLRATWRALSDEELESSFRISVPEGIAPLQLLITVPKKKRRHAVDRVLMRRRIRECWRLQRRPLREIAEQTAGVRTISVALIYMSDENLPTAKIAPKIEKIIAKITSAVAKNNELPPDNDNAPDKVAD